RARASPPRGRAANCRARRTARWPPRSAQSAPAGGQIAIGEGSPGYTPASTPAGTTDVWREVAGTSHLFRDRPEPGLGHGAPRPRLQGRVAPHGARAVHPRRTLDLPVHRPVVDLEDGLDRAAFGRRLSRSLSPRNPRARGRTAGCAS